MIHDVETWIERLNLEPHPEGGYYRETYRADASIPEAALPDRFDADQHLHTVVPAGTWFGATVTDGTRYTLAGCTTAPAFDFADFEMADRKTLIDTYPEHRSVIEQLTRGTEQAGWSCRRAPAPAR